MHFKLLTDSSTDLFHKKYYIWKYALSLKRCILWEYPRSPHHVQRANRRGKRLNFERQSKKDEEENAELEDPVFGVRRSTIERSLHPSHSVHGWTRVFRQEVGSCVSWLFFTLISETGWVRSLSFSWTGLPVFQGSTCHCLASTWIMGMNCRAQVLHGCWRSRLFPSSAVSLALSLILSWFPRLDRTWLALFSGRHRNSLQYL